MCQSPAPSTSGPRALAHDKHMKRLIINADDLGICRSTNRAIAEAFRHGVLTSTSLMANGPAFEDALEHVVRPNPELGVGLHVCLTNARSLLPRKEIPLLVDDRGRFRHGFLSLYQLTLTRPKAAAEQIGRELSAQFERLMAAGVSIDHVDGHRHVHMIPAVFRTVTRLARRYRRPGIRISHEPYPRLQRLLQPSRLPLLLTNLPKKLVLSTLAAWSCRHADGLQAPDRVFGILDSGRMDFTALQAAIASASDGLTEIITHPGGQYPDLDPAADPMESRFLGSPWRHAEFQALVDQRVRNQIGRLGVVPASYPHPLETVDCAATQGRPFETGANA